MKKRPLKHIGNFFIWIVPIIIILIIALENYQKFQQEASTKFKVELWVCFIIVIMALIYWFKSRQLIKDHLLKAFVLEKRANPIWVVLNSIFALLPLVAVSIIYQALIMMQQDLTQFLKVILAVEVVGRLCLIFDSFGVGGNEE